MASSYSSNIRLELMTNGEQDSQWGTRTNTNLQLLEASIAGRAAVTHDDTANYTLTTANGSADEARRMIINIGGALGAARNTVVPTQSKLYVAKNATTGGFATTLKTSGGTGITIPNGKTTLLFCDGTNVVDAIDWLSALTIGGALSVGTTLNVAGASTLTGLVTIGTGQDLKFTTAGQGILSDTNYRAISFNNQAVTIPGTLALTATATPTGTGAGAVGQIAWDTSYLYICTATNDWRRVALADF